MALADLLKAFSLSEPSLRGSSTSTTTQVVGLLSVLAISGSVALFTLGGKLKLTTGANTDTSQPYCRDGLTTAAESGPLKTDGTDGLIREEESASGPSKLDGRDRAGGVKASRKRVRFADDVVEPRGNSEEYRQRFTEMRQQQEGVSKSKGQPSNSIPANRMALYRGLRQHRLQHSASFFS